MRRRSDVEQLVANNHSTACKCDFAQVGGECFYRLLPGMSESVVVA